MKTTTSFISLTVGLSLGLAALALPAAPAAAGVIISSNDVRAFASGDGTVPVTSDTFSGTTIPASHTLSATDGAASSEVDIDYSMGGSWTTFSNALDQQRPGTQNALARATSVALIFTVDVASTYEVSGSYSATHANDAGRVILDAFLRDQTIGQTLHHHVTESRATASESFTLGSAGGDFNNFIAGSLTGSLVVGHTYLWFRNASTVALDADSGATATGNLTLTIHEAIPEPATLALFGLGLAGLGFAGRRKAA